MNNKILKWFASGLIHCPVGAAYWWKINQVILSSPAGASLLEEKKIIRDDLPCRGGILFPVKKRCRLFLARIEAESPAAGFVGGFVAGLQRIAGGSLKRAEWYLLQILSALP